MDETEVHIKSLTLKIGDSENEVSVSDAKQLKKALDELFEKEVHWVHHQVYTQPWWDKPTVTWRDSTDYTWSGGGVTLCSHEKVTDGVVGNV